MRLGSIFVGLAAFGAVTTAFLLALTLMVSGPPDWSEMEGLTDISSSAISDIGKIGDRIAAGMRDLAPDESPAPQPASPAEPIEPSIVAPPERAFATPAPQSEKARQEDRRVARVARERPAPRVERARREPRMAAPRRTEAAPLERNPVCLQREMERGEAPSAPTIAPDPEPEPPAASEEPDEAPISEGDGQTSEDEYYERLEREASEREYQRQLARREAYEREVYERERGEREQAEREYYRWRWR